MRRIESNLDAIAQLDAAAMLLGDIDAALAKADGTK
jgi:hypothetical protein